MTLCFGDLGDLGDLDLGDLGDLDLGDDSALLDKEMLPDKPSLPAAVGLGDPLSCNGDTCWISTVSSKNSAGSASSDPGADSAIFKVGTSRILLLIFLAGLFLPGDLDLPLLRGDLGGPGRIWGKAGRELSGSFDRFLLSPKCG